MCLEILVMQIHESNNKNKWLIVKNKKTEKYLISFIFIIF